jgi:hypothetical protein
MSLCVLPAKVAKDRVYYLEKKSRFSYGKTKTKKTRQKNEFRSKVKPTTTKHSPITYL